MISQFILIFLAGAAWAEIPTRVEIEAEIRYRYVRTEVRSTMTNPDTEARELTFAMILPEPAFISNFSILAGGEEYVASVMDSKEARAKYNNAKEMSLSTGLVQAEYPKERKFSIKVNVEAQQEISFKLTYEERLERENGHYKYQLYLETLYNIESLNVSVDIKESLPITDLCLPLNNSDTTCNGLPAHYEAQVERRPGSSEARVLYSPADTSLLEAGLSVMYSVQSVQNEIQVVCGHFVHRFCPDHLPSPKHVLFILDTSGSMERGNRLGHLKSAMENMLSHQLQDGDYFSILSFDKTVSKFQDKFYNKLGVFKATRDLIFRAGTYVSRLIADGGTNINQALLDGISLAEEAKEVVGRNTVRLIVFLTDGDPTVGERDVDKLVENVIKRNKENIPILTLGFGTQTNFKLLQLLPR